MDNHEKKTNGTTEDWGVSFGVVQVQIKRHQVALPQLHKLHANVEGNRHHDLKYNDKAPKCQES
jgi:hypothetical protein